MVDPRMMDGCCAGQNMTCGWMSKTVGDEGCCFFVFVCGDVTVIYIVSTLKMVITNIMKSIEN